MPSLTEQLFYNASAPPPTGSHRPTRSQLHQHQQPEIDLIWNLDPGRTASSGKETLEQFRNTFGYSVSDVELGDNCPLSIMSISMSVYCFHVDILGRPSCVTDSVCKPGCEICKCRHAAGNQRSCATTRLCT